jgi:tetratricopeptide (TPR) repeat protein
MTPAVLKRLVRERAAVAGLAAIAAAAAVAVAVATVSAVHAGEASAEDVLGRAREAASADRHGEAIRLYLEAVALDSLLESSVAIELGHQYTWAEKPDSALIWFRRYLAAHPGDREARLGTARALSWAGRLDQAETLYSEIVSESGAGDTDALLGLAKVKAWREDREGAEKVYEQVLAYDSANTDARFGLAEVANWSGKHRRARALCQDILADDPGNRDATRGLAEALYGLGRGDLAIALIEKSEPNPDLDRTAAEIRGSKEPNGNVSYSYWENTDDGIFRSASFEATFPVGYLTELAATYLRGTLHKQGLPDIARDQFSVSLSRRFSETVALTIKPGAELNRFSPVVVPPAADPVDDFDLFVWDAYVTVTPRDWMRIDAGTFRETMKIHEPIFRRIHVTTESAGLDWRHTHRIATYWQARYSSYSDGNSRFAALHRGEWNPPVRLPYRYNHRIVLLEGIDYFDFSKELSNGYFNPSSYTRPYVGMRFATDIGRAATLSVEGQFGAEKDSGLGWASVGSFDGSVRVRAGGGVYLTAGYFKSGSRLTSPDGFRAEGVYAALDLAGTR